MGHGSTEEWRVFQERVADCLRRIPLCRVTVGETLHGTRIESVEMDVVARFASPHHGFVFTVLIECKFWKTRVPQEKIFALKAIVDDVGAQGGILVSEVGHQKGVREYLNSPINVEALTFAELEKKSTFAKIGALALGSLALGSRIMHVGVCSDCGQQITYPFDHPEEKDLFCSDCFLKHNRPWYGSMIPGTRSLADSVGFDLIASDLGNAVESAMQVALKGGAVFAKGTDPLSIFRESLAESIRDIETHPRGRLFQEFLFKGPYEDIGEKIPAELAGKRLSDADTAAAITFIYSHMVNCFKGAITELLAAKPCMELMRRLQRNNELPRNTRAYIGDSVRIHTANGKRLLKGADLHFMVEEHRRGSTPCVSVVGVAEVKSYICSESRLHEQLDRHLRRAKQGLQVRGVDYPTERVNIGRRVVRISVLPSNWKLPRSFRFEESESGHLLHVDAGEPPRKDDEITHTGDNEWRITLKWSKEALAEAAFEMTFWYMEKIGEVIYSKSVPKGWEEMTPAEAGRNAAKMMLYYAILRCRTMREEQRAIALYNSYGYGYALGMNYKNAEGRRQMLWPQDLEEILSAGTTKSGCILR